jgi:protein-S-isoprenylcysteine O-methyltransferase Ste14
MSSPTSAALSSRSATPSKWLREKRPEDLALDILIAVVWIVYAGLYLMKALRGGGLVHLGQMGAMTVFATLFLLRRPARRTGAPWETVLAVMTVLMPVALQPAPGYVHWLGEAIQVAGLGGMIIAVVSLGRSFGVAPADRGLRTTGLYRWLRHPLYAMEILVFAGFLLANTSWWNLRVLSLNTLLQIIRITREERILDGYAGYAATVRWRLIPLIW